MANEKTCIIDETQSQTRPKRPTESKEMTESSRLEQRRPKRPTELKEVTDSPAPAEKGHTYKENLSFPISMKPENGPYRESDKLDTKLQSSDKLDMKLQSSDKLEMKLQSSDKLKMKLQSSDKLDMKLQSSQ